MESEYTESTPETPEEGPGPGETIPPEPAEEPAAAPETEDDGEDKQDQQVG